MRPRGPRADRRPIRTKPQTSVRLVRSSVGVWRPLAGQVVARIAESDTSLRAAGLSDVGMATLAFGTSPTAFARYLRSCASALEVAPGAPQRRSLFDSMSNHMAKRVNWLPE